jgi:GNAT superfamily N-acetyltransferase
MIRRATTVADARATVALIRRLAEFEHLEGPDSEAEARFVVDGFERDPPCFEVYLAGEPDQPPVGYVLIFQSYSTFLCRPSIYIEDLFVVPEVRGSGHGKALLMYCIRLAKERGCGRVEWTVLDWNTTAQDFYKSLGAKHVGEWFPYRLTMDVIEELVG